MQASMEGFLSPESKPRKTVKLESSTKKRDHSPDGDAPARKRTKTAASTATGQKNARGDLGEKATASDLAEEGETPLAELQRTMIEGAAANAKIEKESKGETVLYWMRMKDLRIKDNRALAHASEVAKQNGRYLIALFVFSPNDFRAHHRSARRIDFLIRNLKLLKEDLRKLNIPLHVLTVTPRKSLPTKIVEFAAEVKVSHICANLEYEVDELGQLISVYKLAHAQSIACVFMDDQSIVAPGKVLTKQGKPYSVFSPWYRNWSNIVTTSPQEYIAEVPAPSPNASAILSYPNYLHLFDSKVPDYIDGFKLDDADKAKMEQWWPAGTDAGEQRLAKFVGQKVAKGKNDANIGPGSAELQEKPAKENTKNLLASYGADRSRPDMDGSSRISAYLAAGVISIRATLRATLPFSNGKLKTDKDSSIGTWVSEISWRDFYQHVLASWPRVCRGKAFQQKYDGVIWEYDEAKLQAWKSGTTGFPIVDAGMRQVVKEGFMHNRCRMVVAQFLSKDLLFDWRLGERFFMENLIDGDFGSNNGGWQWSAGTGTDPQRALSLFFKRSTKEAAYFRIFNPLSQSEKSDPDGAYIRKYVPELQGLSGKAVHDPHKHLSKAAFEKLGYPKPMVDHATARKRALVRFKK